MSTINEKLCGFAIDESGTSEFEKFCHSFHAALTGTSFIPLGGVHDGGADGFEESLYESGARAHTFLQASKTPKIEEKVRQTVRRLREFRREPKLVTFYFGYPLATADVIEEKLSNELDVIIKIRSKSYIVAQINFSVQSIQAYKTYLEPSIAHLLGIGGAGNAKEYPFSAKTACAFVGQEINRRRGNASVLEAVTDALILWSLEGTDPEKGEFLSYEQILEKILAAIPASSQFIKGSLKNRLDRLSSKANSTGREVSWHRKNGGYALRIEDRRKLLEENAEELEIFSGVGDEIAIMSRQNLPESLHKLIPHIILAVRNCIESVFRKQGLEIGVYISGSEGASIDGIEIGDEIERQVDGIGARPAERNSVRKCVAGAVGRIIYSPSEIDQRYMERLSATYFVLFALKNEPRVVEYFQGMSRNLTLYVGSDLLVKALSEYHLPVSGRMITNALALLKDAGSTLILSDSALEEVFTHIHASVLEFENFYSHNERRIGEEFIQYIDRILIRAYFYARVGLNTVGTSPRGWQSYINQFCSYGDVRKKRGQDALRLYLCDKFGLDFEDKLAMQGGVDREEHALLEQAVLAERNSDKTHAKILACNDALQALRVFSRRREMKENIVPNPFGFKTWWLSHERATERASAKVFRGERARFVMRPEFLVNYISLLPSSAEVVRSYQAVFPTILGVSLGRKVPKGLLHEVLASAQKAGAVDESRAKVILGEMADRLKSDGMRIYETGIATV